MILKFLLVVFIPLVFGQQPPPPTTIPTPSCEGIEEFTYVASLNDCRLYYQCIGGQAYQLQCPRGNYFDTGRQTCVPYAESDCPLLTPPPPVLPTCNDVPEFGYIPSLEACELYYQCFAGQQWRLQCPRGLYFSFERQTCVNRDESDCPLLSPTPTPPTSPLPPTPPPVPTCDDVPEFGYIPSLNDCALYYQCFAGQQWQMQCPRGNYFSFRNQTCVPYAQSDCPLLNPPPGPPTGPPTGPPPSSLPPPTGIPSTAPPLPTPAPEESCEDGNCYQNIETAPIFNGRKPKFMV